MKKDVLINFRCTSEEKKKLEELVALTDRSASTIIRRLLNDYYKTLKDVI